MLGAEFVSQKKAGAEFVWCRVCMVPSLYGAEWVPGLQGADFTGIWKTSGHLLTEVRHVGLNTGNKWPKTALPANFPLLDKSGAIRTKPDR